MNEHVILFVENRFLDRARANGTSNFIGAPLTRIRKLIISAQFTLGAALGVKDAFQTTPSEPYPSNIISLPTRRTPPDYA